MSPSEEDNANPITEEQHSILLSLNEICSEETIDTCRRALERNSWNLENAVMELISPEPERQPEPVETPAPPVQSVSRDAFADFNELTAEFDEDGHQIDGFIDRVTPANNTSTPNLRHRRPTNQNNTLNQRNNAHRRNETYADAIRRNRRQPTILERCINFTLKLFFTTFRLPVTLLQSITRFLPQVQSSSITSSSRKSPRQEVISSVELIKSKFPIYDNLNFTRCSYQDVLTKSKSQVRYLLCYLHVEEHEKTDDFLSGLYPKIEKFMEDHDAILWACRLNSFEGEKASGELLVPGYPTLSLLAPQNAARVNVLMHISGAEHWEKMEEACLNFSGEMTVLKDELRQRLSDQRLRAEQEMEYR